MSVDPQDPLVLALAFRLSGGDVLPGSPLVLSGLAKIAHAVCSRLALADLELPRAPQKWVSELAGQDLPATLHGCITEHPAWAAAGVSNGNPGFLWVQAAYIASYCLNPLELGKPPAIATTREAGLFVRRVAGEEALLRRLEHLREVDDGTWAGLSARLIDFVAAAGNEDGPSQYARGLERFVEYALSKATSKPRAGPIRRQLRRLPGEFFEDSSSASEVIEAPPDREAQRRRAASAAAPSGEGLRSAVVAVRDDMQPSARDDVVSAVIRARTKARALRTEGQMLPFGSNRLQRPDVKALCDWLARPVPTAPRIAAVLSFLSGQFCEEAERCLVLRSLPAAPQARLTLVMRPLCFVVQTPVPKGRFEPDPDEAGIYRPVQAYLILPIPQNFPGVKLLLEVARTRVWKSLIDPCDVTQKLATELRAVNQTVGVRLSATRIAQFLERIMVDLHGDRADAAFFSSREDAEGCAARLYYYAPRLRTLAEKYVKTWSDVWSGISDRPLVWSWSPERGPALDESAGSLPGGYPAVRVGSAGVPDLATARAVVARLRKRTAQLSRGRRSSERIQRLHNQLTAYTAAMALWSSGIRAVDDPIELELLDLVSGFMAVNDKDRDEYPSTRVVWFPELVCRQLRFYHEHRAALLRQFRLKQQPVTWLFFLDGKKALTVTPGLLLRHLGPDYPFRSSSQRHFIRTELRERGVAGVDVDALLGHGRYGEEPYGPYSCYSPQRLASKIGPAVEALARAVNWKAIPGLRLRTDHRT